VSIAATGLSKRASLRCSEEGEVRQISRPNAEVPSDLQSTTISRRRFLSKGTILLGGGTILSRVLAAPTAAASSGKISQAQAKYQNAPKGASRCDRCVQFQPPSACKIVDGVISPSGSCTFFAPRKK